MEKESVLKYEGLSEERICAIAIMEAIAERLGRPHIFDCKGKGDTTWYDFEDMITGIIETHKKPICEGE